MKWYIEFPVLYVVVVIVLYSMNYNTWEEASLFVSVILGLILSSIGYTMYTGMKKKESDMEKKERLIKKE